MLMISLFNASVADDIAIYIPKGALPGKVM